VKLGVLYSAMGLLGVLFGITVVRLIIFTVLWVVTGRSLWLLPNLYSDDVPISHILSPLWAEDAPPPGKAAATPPSLARRLAVAAGAAALVHALYRATPDGKGVVNNLKGANKSILEMLNLHEPPKSISGGGGDNATAAVSVAPSSLGGLGGMGGGSASAVPPTAATAAAQALQRGAAGPAGVAAAREEALAEALRNLAPIPDDPDLEEEGPPAVATQEKAEGAEEGAADAEGAEGAAEGAAEGEAAAAAPEAEEAQAAGEAETEAEL
jgi:hypothetical protein